MDVVLGTSEKAHKFNQDSLTHGSFAEIGAGQEVARWFFHVGGAARTVAKTISAYNMSVSDALYGPAQRYVSRQRLQAMLDQEYNQLVEGLGPARGSTTTFFAFADTVATKRPGHKENGRGWVGIRFQSKPFEAPSQVVIHVQLLDTTAVLQQEALGALGVNLVYGAFYHNDDPAALVGSLSDGLSGDRFDVDVINVSGPVFAGVDGRLLSLQLVEQDLTEAVMFTAAGDCVQPSEVAYKRPILAVRGSFRPITNMTLDLLDRSRDHFLQEPAVQGTQPIILAEMTLKNLLSGSAVSHADFLERAQMLHVLGVDVLISRFQPFYQLTDYLAGYTDQMIGLAVGIPTLREIMDEQYYGELHGGVLEATGRLFRHAVKMYVYPELDPATGAPVSIDDIEVPAPFHYLRDFLVAHGRMEALQEFNPSFLSIQTSDVLARIQSGDPSWETMVPPAVAAIVKEQKLLGYQA